MEKAVRWAVHSAKQAAQQPTCTVFVLPGWQDHQHTAYFKWLEAEPSYCFKIASIQNYKHLRYCTPQDRHNGPPYTGCHKSKETIVLLVANQPAFQHLAETMDPDAYAADTVGVRDQALQPTGKPNPQWLPRGLQPPYVPVPFLNPPPVHWW
jgi:hypothetical protein